jgi:predicted XRE-type DNA-binding protein
MGEVELMSETSERIEYTLGSDNVFADLGLPNPEELLAKAQLAAAIHRIIKARKLVHAAAADLMGLGEPEIAAILHGSLTGFSLECLMNCLKALQQDVTINIRPAAEGRGRLLVTTG